MHEIGSYNPTWIAVATDSVFKLPIQPNFQYTSIHQYSVPFTIGLILIRKWHFSSYISYLINALGVCREATLLNLRWRLRDLHKRGRLLIILKSVQNHTVSLHTMLERVPLSKVYCIAGKFGRELNLAVGRIDQPTAKLNNLPILRRSRNAISK